MILEKAVNEKATQANGPLFSAGSGGTGPWVASTERPWNPAAQLQHLVFQDPPHFSTYLATPVISWDEGHPGGWHQIPTCLPADSPLFLHWGRPGSGAAQESKHVSERSIEMP